MKKEAHFFACLIVQHPFLVMIISFITAIGLSLIAFLAVPFNISPEGNFYPRHTIVAERYDAFLGRGSENGILGVQLQQSVDYFALQIYYETKNHNDNIFTEPFLTKIKDLERKISLDDQFADFCLLSYGDNNSSNIANQCSEWLSTTFYFFQYPDGNQIGNISAGLHEMEMNYDYGAGYLLPNDFNFDNPVSRVTRSYFYFGLPLKGFDNVNDRYDEQFQNFSDFIIKFSNPLLNAPDKDMIVAFYGDAISDHVINLQIRADIVLSFAAILIVFVLVAIQTWSIFLAFIGILQIVLAAPVAYFIYRFIFNLTWMTALNFMALFVLLGIGADDIFVITDAWKQSKCITELQHDIKIRFSYVWRRASNAMFVTSFTTFVAFLGTAFSAIPTLKVFGIYASLMVAVNYVFAITWYAAAIVVYHEYFENRDCFPSFFCNSSKKESSSMISFYHASDGIDVNSRSGVDKSMNNSIGAVAAAAIVNDGDDYRRNSMQSNIYDNGNAIGTENGTGNGTVNVTVNANVNVNGNGRSSESLQKEASMLQVAQHRFFERFCYHFWSPFIFRYSKILVILFLGLSVYMGICASNIDTPNQPSSALPNGDPLAKAESIRAKYFGNAEQDADTNVYFVYGIKGINRDGVDDNDPDKRGKTIFDSNFNLSPPLAQQGLYETCLNVSAETGLVRSHRCFIEEFRQYRLSLNQSEIVYDENEFNQWMKMFFDDPLSENVRDDFGFNKDVKVSWCALYFSATLQPNPTIKERQSALGSWRTLMENVNANVKNQGVTTLHGYQTSETWVWLKTDTLLKRIAMRGLASALLFCLLTLLIATGNLYVTAMAFLNLCSVVAIVLGLMYLYGWHLEVNETISIVVLAGMAVDYVVHLAVAYTSSDLQNRFGRMREGLTELGVSIFGGSITTCSSTFFFFFAAFPIFFRFGVFVFTAIITSFLLSAFLFPAMMMLFGPLKEQGNIYRYVHLQNCLPFLKRFKKDDHQNQVEATNFDQHPLLS